MIENVLTRSFGRMWLPREIIAISSCFDQGSNDRTLRELKPFARVLATLRVLLLVLPVACRYDGAGLSNDRERLPDAARDTSETGAMSPGGPVANKPDAMSSDGPAADGPRAISPDGAAADGPRAISPDGPPASVPRVIVEGNTATDIYGGGGGSTHTDVCPDNRVLVGYEGAVGQTLNSSIFGVIALQAICAEPVVRSQNPSDISLTSARSIESRGGSGGSRFSALCPPDQVIVSFTVRSGTSVDQLQFQCARLSLTGDATPEVRIGAPTALEAFGGTGGSVHNGVCPTGLIARGHMTRDGDWLDAYGLICGTPKLMH